MPSLLIGKKQDKLSRSSEAFFEPRKNGVKCNLKVTANASQNIVAKIKDGVLKVRVTATPEDGKANDAVIKLLSREWKISASSMAIISGQSKRHKMLYIKGNPEKIIAAIDRY